MIQQLHIYILLFILTTVPSVVLSQSSVQADIDQYRLQRGKNIYEKSKLRHKQLLDITPPEKLMKDFVERGFDGFYDTISLFDLFDPDIFQIEERRRIIAQCHESVDKYKSQSLKRILDLLTLDLMNNETQYDLKIEGMEEVARRCQKAGDHVMEAHSLHLMFHTSYYSTNYARGFAYAARLADVLDRIGDDYPLKRMRYINIGTAYYSFRDYDRAYSFLHKALSFEPKSDCFFDKKEVVYCFNYLAAYHHTKGNLDSVAYYIRQTLTYPGSKILDPVSLDIAMCNLGYLEIEKGNYDDAIAMIVEGAENMKDNMAQRGFIYGAYIALGQCMIAKGDMPAVKKYIEEAKNGMKETKMPFNLKTMISLFKLEAKYYSRLGQHDKADRYLDSMIIATEKLQGLTGQNVILLGEQQLKEAEIDQHKKHISYQHVIILISISILVLILAGLFIILRLYRKRNAAYKVLAIKAEEWATRTVEHQQEREYEQEHQQEPESSTPKPHPEITQEDQQIMLLLQKEMKDYVYREAGLTAEILADRLGIHRNALSHAINRTTASNFNTYINGFRIKEAVRIISQTNRKDLYIDELSERVGFGSRSSFSRIFKQFTGLSPLEFQKQEGTNSKS